jgi:arylsulfatase A-like enzyme
MSENHGFRPAMLAAALFFLTVPAVAQVPQSAIVIVLDDVAAADLALYGGPVAMPRLEQLAARGVTFDTAYGMATCSPTRRSMLAGHWWIAESGDPCGAPVPNTPLLSEVFLPEALPGHQSAIFGKWHVGANPTGGPVGCAPIAHGFTHWISGLPSNVTQCGGSSYWLWTRADSAGCASVLSTSYAPQTSAAQFRSGWLGSEGPRVAVIGASLPHGPFHVPPLELLPPGYPTPVTNRQKYEAMLRAQDTLLGQMLAGISLADTLIVVLGDNGTPDNVAPDPNRAKTTVFERGVRVPLIIAGGPAVKGARASELVHAVDVYATVIAALGGTVPTTSGPYPVVSVSLVPLLQGTAGAVRAAALLGTGWGTPGGERGVVSGGLKLRQVDANGDTVPELEQLFDLAIDPSELMDQSTNPLYAADMAALRAFATAETP